MLRILQSAFIVIAISPVILAQPQKPAPGTEPPKVEPPKAAAAGPAPANSGDPAVDELLDKLEAKGDEIKGLSCKLRYNYVTVDPVESSQVKTGDLKYLKPTGANINGMFKIHFRELDADGIKSKHEEQIAFDGNWLIERNDKAKTIIRREVVKKGQTVNPFELGKGPFPMPFGQKRADMLQHFKIKKTVSGAGDPPNTVHLHCEPHPHSNMASRYRQVRMWIDKGNNLPVKMVCERLADDNRIEVTFTEVDTKAAPGAADFKIEEPADFDKRLEPITDEPAGPNDNAPPPPAPPPSAKGK